jgi:hypothetical protein
MTNDSRRAFLKLLGLAAPAAALAPKIDPSTIPETAAQAAARIAAEPKPPSGPYRFLGLAQLKNEGDPICLDDSWEEEA